MTVNVHDFGAVGDDEHDDTAAFQAAIDATAMEALPPDVVRTLEGRLRGVAAETARRDARMLAIGTPEPAEAGIYQTQRLPSRIGIGDGPDVPCRFVAVDMAFRPSEPFPHVPLPATVVSGERGEDGVLRFDVTFDRDALARWIASMTEAFRAFGEQMRVTAEATVGVMRPLGEWIEQNRDAIERAAAEDANRYLRAWAVPVAETLHNPDDEEMVRRFSQVRTASDFMVDADGAPTDPELETAKNWLAGGSTCAHVCGPDPGHVCDARATTTIQHALPSGGTRTLPLCGPCADAESAAEPGAADGEGEPVQGLDVAARGLAAGGWVTVPVQPPPVDRLFVIAATRVQFTEWCYEVGISPHSRRAVHVTDHRQLRGAPHGLRYLVLGWPAGPGFTEVAIRDMLRCRGALGVSAEECQAWRESLTRGSGAWP